MKRGDPGTDNTVGQLWGTGRRQPSAGQAETSGGRVQANTGLRSLAGASCPSRPTTQNGILGSAFGELEAETTVTLGCAGPAPCHPASHPLKFCFQTCSLKFSVTDIPAWQSHHWLGKPLPEFVDFHLTALPPQDHTPWTDTKSGFKAKLITPKISKTSLWP
uniref:Uncharacterized protein n=1 Tax=Myotis myotis TaxID=51298 RepID=A0A7J7SRA2_MYOMY|nr:hypothetical protein mMyoMyo1_009369 [Myotis myotis]